MAHEIPKLSLVAQFDDLCRVSNSLMVGSEDSMLLFIMSYFIIHFISF